MKRKKNHRPPRIPQRAGPTTYLLDQFSEADVAHWRQRADAQIEYATKVYFHLEAERGLRAEAIRNALASADAMPLRLDGWTRIIDYRHSLEPLSSAGSLRKGGRFNIGRDIDANRFPPFPALYLAEDYETAYAEKFGAPSRARKDSMSGAEFALRSPTSFASVRIQGQLRQLFDLTVTGSLRRFMKVIAGFRLTEEMLDLAREANIPKPYMVETTRQLRIQLLDEDWRRNPTQFGLPSNSQVFARLVRDAGFEGILYQSVRGPRRCIALFPDMLSHEDTWLSLADATPKEVRWPRLDATTARELA